MASFNKVIIAGNLTRDPELRYTPKGTAIANISLAVNHKWTNEAGEKKEEVTFVDCSAFGRTAETLGQYMRKGRPLLVEGRLRQETWDDKATGAKRSRLTVVIESCQFLGGNEDKAVPAAAAQKRPAATAAEPVAGDEPAEREPGVPF